MRVLVTGSSGYLGRAFCAAAEGRHEVMEVDLAARHYIDITQPENVKRVWHREDMGEEGPEVIVNFAAIVGEEKCRAQPVRAEEVNGLGPLGLARAFPEAFFIQVSTASVLGPRDRDTHPYAYSKCMAEKVLRAYVPAEKLVIVRLGTVFGAGTGPVRWEILLNKMTRDALERGKVCVPAQNFKRPLVSVKRVVKSLLEIVQDPGLCCVGIRRNVSLIETVPVCAFNASMKDLPALVAHALEMVVFVEEKVADGDLRDYTLPVTVSEWSEEEGMMEIRGLRAAWKRETQ